MGSCVTCQAIDAAVAAGNDIPLAHELARQLAAASAHALVRALVDEAEALRVEVARLTVREQQLEDLAREALLRLREQEGTPA
jgi:hypothetical protein